MRALRLTAVLLLAAGAASGQAVVTAELSERQVSVGHPFSIIVKIEGKYPNKLPEIPEVDGLDIDRRNPSTSQSSNFSIINGQMRGSTTRAYTYRGYALREGEFTIPAITVAVEGKTYTTQPLTLSVTPRGQRSRPQADASGRTRITYDDVVFIEARINKAEVYQGEAVITAAEFWILDAPGSVRVMNGSVSPPNATNFYTGKIVKTGSRKASRGSLNYKVEVYELHLYPQGVGESQIAPWGWEGKILANMELLSLSPRSEPMTVRVKPLPSRPANFSGAVGDFDVQSYLTNADVMQGQPVAYRVRVRGKGIPDFIGAPDFPELDWAAVAEPALTLVLPDKTNDWTLDKVFSYEITPVVAGKHEIPPVAFVYFDPERGNYVTKKLESRAINIKPSGEAPGLVVFGGQSRSREGVTILADDIQPIIAESGPLRAQRSRTAAHGAGLALPPAAFSLFLLYMRRRKRFEDDPRYARKYFARSKSRERLAAMDAAEDPVETMHRAALGFVADHFDVNEAGLTSDDVKLLLETNGAETDTRDNLVKVLRACERRRYGGAALSADELGALRQGAERAMDALDAPAKGGQR